MAVAGNTAAFLTRFSNATGLFGGFVNATTNTTALARSLSIVGRRAFSVDIDSVIDTSEDVTKPKKKMSKAMKAYLERAKEYDAFMKEEITKYQIGKRHLANMMGENAETFTQADVNKAIRYLFPSGLYERRARPIMEAPEKIFPPRKAAQFDDTGRPHESLFYTCKPNYYQSLHDIVKNIYSLNEIEDAEVKRGLFPHPDEKINLLSSQWFSKDELEEFLLEPILDEEYDKFLAACNRLAEHPYAFRVKDFILKFRKRLLVQAASVKLPEIQYTPEGRPYVTTKDCKRKSAIATVTVYGKGTGKITINDKDISYFWNIQAREQVSQNHLL